MTISVIINTINRPQTLIKCLQSLSNQSDKEFELIVVDQSEGDETKYLCDKYQLKYLRSNVRNISVSRNLGIANASGDIVAFIDDDAEADVNWIKYIKENFAANKIDLLAGKVIDNNDPKNPIVQFQNGIISCYGYTEDVHALNFAGYETVKNNWHLFALGANSIFLKSKVIEVGGFDEYYEYIHDETDLASRIMYAGGRAKYDDRVLVYHYPAKSHNRDSKHEINWRVLTKNYFYFAMKNGKDIFPIRFLKSLKRIVGSIGPFVRVVKLISAGEITFGKFLKYKCAIQIGLLQGIIGGVFFKRKLNLIPLNTNYLPFKLANSSQ